MVLEGPRLEGFIVLGAPVNPQGKPGRVARLRLVHALNLWRQGGAHGYILLTGGQRPGTYISEAQAMAGYALAWAEESWGLDFRVHLTTRLIVEENSLNTAASARNTLVLVQDLSLKEVGLVSDSLHMRRAHHLFRRHFRHHPINLYPLPVPGVLKHYWQNRRYLWLSKMALREGGAWLKLLGHRALFWRRGLR
ncbi:MAG: hypothetical protein A2Y80_09535 [Deltaproteobacteria bacterium RBG_13_58_19]|nr:MAG: hypothetical protein A2Y80_09535 [Deltaproteobacteria bacterium RBG_13_58_19]